MAIVVLHLLIPGYAGVKCIPGALQGLLMFGKLYYSGSIIQVFPAVLRHPHWHKSQDGIAYLADKTFSL